MRVPSRVIDCLDVTISDRARLLPIH